MSDSYSDSEPEKSGIDSPNATRFNPSDASNSSERKFKRLWFYNENLKRDRTNTNSSEVRRREQSHILDAISSSLELPSYQHTEARTVVTQTNFTEEVSGRYLSIETYCFGICVLIHNQNVRKFQNKHLPEKSDSQNPDIFVNTMEEIDITDTELRQSLDELEKSVVDHV